ncbi:hypothetical protein BDQ17DRAFT_1332368 [Cyathus striatus]|nr:hypothetical protein BDQ17DRAFT_1332368 [Cyathus striatus]
MPLIRACTRLSFPHAASRPARESNSTLRVLSRDSRMNTIAIAPPPLFYFATGGRAGDHLTLHVQKERAAVGSTEVVKTKAKDKEKKAESGDELMARMERAMKEADWEQSSESESVDGDGFTFADLDSDSDDFDMDSDEDGFGSIDEDDSGMEYSDVDSIMSADEGDEEEEEEFTVFGMNSNNNAEAPPPPTAMKRKINPIHLSDDLFTAAFAPKAEAVVVPGVGR